MNEAVRRAKWFKADGKNYSPLTPKALKEMRRVMDGILSGELNHDQSTWHEVEFYETDNPEKDEYCSAYNYGAYCNSAHCFAGWVEVIGKKADIQHKSFLSVEPYLTQRMINYFRGNGKSNTLDGDYSNDAENYAAKRFGMTYNESNLLFNAYNTKRQLNSIVKRFENGYRLKRI